MPAEGVPQFFLQPPVIPVSGVGIQAQGQAA